MIALRLLLLASFGLAACAGPDAWDVAAARSAGGAGDDFQRALRAEYLDLAEFERAEYDWTEVAHYLRRAGEARTAAPEPDQLASRVLPAEPADLVAARTRLLAAFEDGGREAEPAQAAKAQAGFECWLEQHEEGHQLDHIAACRKQYEVAIAAVEEAIKPPPLRSVVVLLPDDEGVVGRVDVKTAEGGQTLDQAREAARLGKAPARWRRPFEIDEKTVDARFGRALAVPREVIRRYVLYFEDNSVELTPESKALLPEVVAVVRSFGRKRVSITGYADRFGSDPRNNVIAFQRALELRDILAAAGVSTTRIAPDEQGERAPAKPTSDGVKEPANRRVVIDFE